MLSFASTKLIVMAGLGSAIHESARDKDVDARVEPGHDDLWAGEEPGLHL
jgi:hypothetical protein